MKYNKNKKEIFEMIMDSEIENLNKALGLIDDKTFKGAREAIKNRIASRETAKRDFDKTFKEYQEMKEKIDKFNKELNSNINQYFDLRFKI